MTTASLGLAKALGRSASGETIAIAEMTTADLLASLSDEQKTGLQAELAPPAPAATAASEDGDEDDATPKPKKDGEDEQMGSDAAAAAAPVAAASTDRVKAVAAAIATDDACKGKADLALSLLADDDFAGLSASALVKMIAKTPVEGASASAAAPDAEAAARAEMREAIGATGNSSIDAGSAPTGAANERASIDTAWDRARASINPTAKGAK